MACLGNVRRTILLTVTVSASLLCSQSLIVIAAKVGTCRVKASDEENLSDDAITCRILKDLPSVAVLYAGEDVCFCVVSTSACSLASFEGLPYSGKLKFNSTEEKKLPVYKFCLENGVISLRDNGALVHFLLLNNDLINTLSSAQSTTTNLTVLGPPDSTQHLNVVISCTTVFINWLPSDTASYYIISVQCGGTYVINETVDSTNYQFKITYQHNLYSRHCVVSVVAVNGAGPSEIKNTIAVLAKDPVNAISDIDIKVAIQKDEAFAHVNMIVNELCPTSLPSYLEICVVRTGCVNISTNITDTSWDTDVIELPLPLHNFYNVTISICNEPKFPCKVVGRKLSTFHIQKAGSCNSSGNCLLYCELARGSQIKGCVYKFSREDKVSFNVFVLAETVKPYTLEEGQYDVSIYDWPWEEDWRANPPAFNEIITVTKPRIDDNTINVIGIAFGTVVLVLMIGIAIISSIIVYVKCYKKSHTRYEGISMYSVIMPRMLCGWCTDTAGGQDLENHSRRDEQNIELNLDQLPDNERKEGEIEKAAADVCVTSFNSMDPDDTLSVPSEVSEQQQPLANSTAVEEIDKNIENGLLGAEQTDCKTTEEKEVHMTMVDGVSETETTYDGSDLPLLDQFKSPLKRKYAQHVGGKLQSQMVVPESEVNRYANFAHEDTGTSVLTGEAMVASTEKDHKNSAYLIGGQLVPMKKEVVNETYSPGDPSQAQTPMDPQTHEVVS